MINQYFRYGSMDELKELVKIFHEANIKVLGDAVLNHRCAQFQNNNGVWNIFGGRMNWDDQAVVADDPHFQVWPFFSKIYLFRGLSIWFSVEHIKNNGELEQFKKY